MSTLDARHQKSDVFLRRSAPPDFKHTAKEWEVWTCEGPSFEHVYDQGVTLFVDQGAAVISFSTGEQVALQAGDLLTIAQGAQGSWNILQPLRNLYRYS